MEDFLRKLEDVEYSLSPLDVIPNHLYLSNAFFYKTPSNAQKKNLSADQLGVLLKTSLYNALKQFPILVGRLRYTGLNDMQIVVNKSDPNLPSWSESTSNIHIDDLERDKFSRDVWPDGVNVTDPLLHTEPDGGSTRLLRVSVCHLAQGSGLVIAVRIAHSVFDAKGCTAFINHWARCSRNAMESNKPYPSQDPRLQPVPAPILDRQVMYQHLPPSVRPGPAKWFLLPLSLLLRALLSIVALLVSKQTSTGSSESHLFSISKIWLKSAKASSIQQSSGQVSDNDVITALITMGYAQTTVKKAAGATPTFWRRIIGQRKPAKISAIVPCDFRHRLGVPENYTGSCAIGLYVTAPISTLLKPISLASLGEVAAISRRTVDEVDVIVIERFIRRALQAISLVGDKARILYSLMVCQAFSNQSRLPWYEADFGYGSPRLVVPMAYSKSVAVIFPSPLQEQAVYVFLTLEGEHMSALMKNEAFMSAVHVVY